MKLEKLKSNILERLGRDFLDDFLERINDNLFYQKKINDLLWGYVDETLNLLKDFGLTDNATFALEVST